MERRGAYLLTTGFALGVILPPLLKRVRAAIITTSNTKNNNNSNNAEATKAVENSTHAVRGGLLSSSVRIQKSKLDAFLGKLFVSAGCSSSHANLVASVLSFADARGIPSHGCNRADTYINEIKAGLVDATAEPAVVERSGCCAVVDGRNGLGAVTSQLAMETAIKLAEEHGASVVVCRSSNHYGAAGYWAKMALNKGMIGMSFTNTSPIAVPTGGKTRAVGTNPFCFFAPASEGDSFQLDMATTVVPIGKVEVMDRTGKQVPVGWGVDRNGLDCTSGKEICKFGGLYPLGGAEETAGYKGYGLGMFIEIMCAVLSGNGPENVGPDVKSWSVTRDGASNYGHAFVVIDPKRFSSGFEDHLGLYLNRMRGLPGGNVKVAGDPEKEFEHDATENGIILHEDVATTLKLLAKRLDVAVPEEMRRLDVLKAKPSLYEE
jgi:LDH2 family malate/lactate/ureidoglycolate dehydrogenase